MLRRSTTSPIYGIVAEFGGPDEIIAAAEQARAAGYRRIDAYTPFPIHGLAEAIGFKDALVPWTAFAAGVAGAFAGVGLEVYAAAIDYPLNVGGRPLISWPSFIPVAYELTILFAGFGAAFGMLAYNGLPKLYHSIFNAPRFELASQDKFFLCVESEDPQFDVEGTEHFLRGIGAEHVSIVER